MTGSELDACSRASKIGVGSHYSRLWGVSGIFLGPCSPEHQGTCLASKRRFQALLQGGGMERPPLCQPEVAPQCAFYGGFTKNSRKYSTVSSCVRGSRKFSADPFSWTRLAVAVIKLGRLKFAFSKGACWVLISVAGRVCFYHSCCSFHLSLTSFKNPFCTIKSNTARHFLQLQGHFLQKFPTVSYCHQQ